jgi:3'-5' exoribonuclease
MKKQFIKDLVAGTKVDDVFFVLHRQHSQKRDGDIFLILKLQDRTGMISAKIWDNPQDFSKIAVPGNFVRVEGVVSEYNGENQIVVSNIHHVKTAEVASEDFLPSSRFEKEQMFSELQSYFSEITDTKLRSLVENIFAQEEIRDAFIKAPASTKVHHVYLGGLLEHTLFMLRVAKGILSVYPELDKSLVIAGIILHDIGKIREYQYDKTITHTAQGLLLGHIVIGYELVKEEINKIPGFSQEKAELILHIILSHHGLREYGSPVVPKFPEAYLVHMIDNLDARLNIFMREIENSQTELISDYNTFLGTKVFIPKKEPKE